MEQQIAAQKIKAAAQFVQLTVNAINHVALMAIAIKASAHMKRASRTIAVNKL
ncbi:MAG TPA: hypothetical protein VK806_05715 [Bacteroidia bacterium]|jgi:hypothetical protein|nr:hypothetical protein [Bacteroidia bacterium]